MRRLLLTTLLMGALIGSVDASLSGGSEGGVARAQDAPAEQAIEAVRELIFHARFEDAVTASRRLLDRDDLTAAERNAALEVLAVAQIANRQRDDAGQTLQLLYSRDPGHRLGDPDASPPVISAFARARESHPESVPVVLEHQPPALSRREPPSLEVRVGDGDDAVAEVRLIYRAGDEGSARVVMTRRADGVYVARIPVIGDASQATDVAYHIVALAPSLAPLATVGTAAEPLQLRIPAEAQVASSGGGGDDGAGEPVYRDPGPSGQDGSPPPDRGDDGWVWGLVIGAILAVGVAVTIGVVVAAGDQGPEQGTLGTVTLMQVEL